MAAMAPDRITLSRLEKKPTESFKEYAQRWRDMASLVQPPLTGREITRTFLDTLKNPYYGWLLGYATRDFADMVEQGEEVEKGIKSGKISVEDVNRKSGFSRKKESETHAIIAEERQYHPTINNVAPLYGQSSARTTPVTMPSQTNNLDSRRPRPFTTFDPIPVPYEKAFNMLVEAKVLSPLQVEPMQPPYPKWYDTSVSCAYHGGNPGHSTERCYALKKVIQDMHRGGKFIFSSKTPNSKGNPLPNHTPGGTVGCVSKGVREIVKKKIEEVKTPMEWVYRALIKAQMITPIEGNNSEQGHDNDSKCQFHSGMVGHSLQHCPTFLKEVQKMMDNGLIEFFLEMPEEEVNTVDNSEPIVLYFENEPHSEPVVIHYDSQDELISVELYIDTLSDSSQTRNRHDQPGFEPVKIYYDEKPPVQIEIPAPFPYESDKAVPWDYEYKLIIAVEERDIEEPVSVEIANTSGLTGVGGMTRSGRCYAPEPEPTKTNKEERPDKGKKKVTFEEPTVEVMKEKKLPPMLEKEAEEFLKIIKHSEYSIIDQLSKTPAKISMLSLMLSSKPHSDALVKTLRKAYVPSEITVEDINDLIGNITVSNFINFSDEEVPLGGRGDAKPLHICIYCKHVKLDRVLVDNGSGLNVIPIGVLSQLPVDISHMQKSKTTVRAFDGTKRDVIGDIEIPLRIGSIPFNVKFQVMDISPSYKCLLGRPWIHMAGAIPSSLHQRVKFIVGDRMVIVRGEEDMIAVLSASEPGVKIAEDIPECSFRAFEIDEEVHNTSASETSESPIQKLPRSTQMALRQMFGKGFRLGAGLGFHSQGMKEIIKAVKHEDRFGLGYIPTNRQRADMEINRRIQRIAGSRDQRFDGMITKVPLLEETFVSGGIVHSELAQAVWKEAVEVETGAHITVHDGIRIELLEDDIEELGIHVIEEDAAPADEEEFEAETGNWEIRELPVVFNAFEK